MFSKRAIFLFLFLIVQIVNKISGLAVMSVDLGSEFMKVAIVKPGVPMEIVLNKESRRKTPVAISLKTVERDFGEPAISQAIKYPKTAYLNLRNLLGKPLNHAIVKEFQTRYPYYNIKEDEKTKTIYFQHDSETTYTPEELLAMILEYAKEIASDFAEQPIDAAVITVPAYFTQAERKALLRSAELIKLKVLQLINSNTAAALNYGVFRRKDFNATGNTIMFFDMGSSGTTATVAHYQMIKNKDDYEANPQLTIKGVGFDRSLGGAEFTQRLMKHLAKKFKEEKKKDVFSNPKAILKLQKEADRLKSVLSANSEHVAQIEGLIDDIDLKIKVTREEFEEMCKDLFDRIKKPVEDAIRSAGVSYEEIENVILVGAGTRVPKVQDVLLKITKKPDLGKSLNTDEAPALGAVYQAAFQSKGYKVKKFYIKDLNLYPLVVDFERHNSPTAEEANKIIRRTLFDRNNAYPQKKIMTFNKHDSDFSFDLNYGDLSFFDQKFIDSIGSLNVTHVDIKGVKEVFEKHKDEVSKGIKVHFNMDDSGILNVDKIDIAFEKPEEVDANNAESTLSKIGNKISSFFGGNNNEDEKIKDDDTPKPPPSDEKPGESNTNSENNSENVNDNQANNTTTSNTNNEKEETGKENEENKDSNKPNETDDVKANNQTVTNSTDSAAKNDTKPQPKSIVTKEHFEFTRLSKDISDVDETYFEEKRKKLETIREKEKEKRKRASAVNNLESFIYDTKFKLEEKEFVECSTSDEREKLLEKLNEYDEWLSEADDSVETKKFTEKLSELKSLTKDVYFRVKEKRQRPLKLDELKDVLNASSYFLVSARNLTGEDKPFTEVEVTSLEKLINTTKDWRTKMLEEQSKTPDYEQPKLLTTDINEKIDGLKREVNYLITKAKYFKPKPKKTATDAKKANTTKTEDDKKEDDTKEEKKTDEQEQFDEEYAKKFEKMFDEQQEADAAESSTKKAKKQKADENDANTGEKLELGDGTEESTPNPEL